MNEVEIFKYEEKQVRTQIINNDIWFCLKDICNILELSNSRVVAQRLEEDERRKLDLPRQG